MLTIASLLAVPQMVVDLLNAIATPVLLPLVTSGVVWVLNTYTTLVAKLPNPVKQGLVIVVGVLLGYVGSLLNLDVSSAEGFAASLVALGIYQIGKGKVATP